MRQHLLVPEILELLEEGRHEDLVQVLRELHPKDAAEFLAGLDGEHLIEVLDVLPLEMRRDVFAYLDPDVQEDIIRGAGQERVKVLLTAMASDDRAEFFERLDPRVRDSILPLLTKAAREDLVRRERYEEDQVGALLSTEYCVLRPELTAREAIEEIRRQAPRRETIYYSYVVDDEGRPVGFVSLRDLILARPEQRVSDLMRTEMVSIEATADREEAARLIRDYDLIALPVTDERGRLIGIVTHDDAADIAEEEETEDMERMAGITGEAEEDSYLEESVASLIRRRLPYVVILAFSYVVTASVIHGFERALQSHTVLIALLPMVMAMGGNVGAQTATLVVRAVALQQLRTADLLKVLWKEVRTGLGIGLALAVVVFWVTLYLEGGSAAEAWRVCGAVAVAMVVHVTTAALLGGLIPLLVTAARMDPALVANPALTTIADLSGATTYLLTVSALLDLPGP